MPPSSRGLGHRPFTPATAVRIRLGVPSFKTDEAEQPTEELLGELSAYEKVGLFQRSVNKKTAYRYQGNRINHEPRPATEGNNRNAPGLCTVGQYDGISVKICADKLQ